MYLYGRPVQAGLAPAALLFVACLVTWAHASSGQGRPAGAEGAQERRVAPPSSLGCSRDETTSFEGRVLDYSRGGGRVRVRVRTDADTTEQFTLRYGRGRPEGLFLLRGGPFTAADWRKVETRAGRLRPGVRVIVWACYRGDEIVPRRIDFRPAED